MARLLLSCNSVNLATEMRNACKNGHLEIVELLLDEFGVDANGHPLVEDLLDDDCTDAQLVRAGHEDVSRAPIVLTHV